MAVDFPTGPAVNDLYTYNSVTYKFDGVFWSPQLGVISSFSVDDAINTAVTNFTFTHTATPGTPGVGIGTGIALITETSNGNNEIGAIIEAVTTDVTAASEDFDLRFKLMTAGAAATEKMRIDSVGFVGVNTRAANAAGRFEIADDGNSYNLSLIGYTNLWGGGVSFLHTRNAAFNGHTIVQDNDVYGYMDFYGSDGSARRAGAGIHVNVDGVPGASDMPGRIAFHTTPDGSAGYVERLRITNAGNIVTGFTGGTAAPAYHIDFNKVAAFLYVGFSSWNAGGAATNMYFTHSRSATINGHTVLQNNDELAYIGFSGSDGSVFRDGAYIYVQVDGVPGAGDMPGRIMIGTTPDGAGSPIERWRIDNQGNIIARSATVTPPTLANNGDWVMTPTSNTQMRISYRGSDGTTRVGNITLA